MLTYDEILNRMKTTYFEESESNPNDNEDAMCRMKAVASEIFNLACNADFAKKQMFFQTAIGNYLDYHAVLCGIERKHKRKAEGALRFSVTEPLDRSIAIPTGTICSIEDNPYIQYVTVSDAAINAGHTYVDVSCEALGYGEDYNVTEGTVTVMVNPPAYVESVTNPNRIKGGANEENDEHLRKRIAESYSFIHNGINKHYLREKLTEIDGMVDCNLIFGTRPYVYVMCRTVNDEISDQMRNEINNILWAVSIYSGNVVIRCAHSKVVDFNIIVRNGRQADVESCIKEYINNLRLDENIEEYRCERMVRELCDAGACEVYASSLSHNTDEYITVGRTRVYYYE